MHWTAYGNDMVVEAEDSTLRNQNIVKLMQEAQIDPATLEEDPRGSVSIWIMVMMGSWLSALSFTSRTMSWIERLRDTLLYDFTMTASSA